MIIHDNAIKTYMIWIIIWIIVILCNDWRVVAHVFLGACQAQRQNLHQHLHQPRMPWFPWRRRNQGFHQAVPLQKCAQNVGNPKLAVLSQKQWPKQVRKEGHVIEIEKTKEERNAFVSLVYMLRDLSLSLYFSLYDSALIFLLSVLLTFLFFAYVCIFLSLITGSAMCFSAVSGFSRRWFLQLCVPSLEVCDCFVLFTMSVPYAASSLFKVRPFCSSVPHAVCLDVFCLFLG